MTAPTSADRPVRAIALAGAGLVLLILVPAALIAAGMVTTGYLLFLLLVLLWAVLGLLALAVHRLWLGYAQNSRKPTRRPPSSRRVAMSTI
jgi:membrane protein implicated in regulation of membrane protease activity